MTVFSVGHSNRSADEFISLLKENRVEVLVDVRRFPMSRHSPQFNTDALAYRLTQENIDYSHMVDLGGRRKRTVDLSPNPFWDHQSFRNYADYAMTEPFQSAFDQLIKISRESNVAFMCSEAVWWKCHRRIITDYFVARGIEVSHIMGPGKSSPAKLCEGAVPMSDGSLRYMRMREDI